MDTNNFYIKSKEYIINMPRKIILIAIVVILLIALSISGYFYWKTKTQKSAVQRVADISAEIGNNVSPDVTTPAINLPDANANPYSKTNPFANLKINPFQ